VEHEDFHGKTGKLSSRENIFKNHVDILGGRSHIWQMESVRYTDVFGKFASRVCSKLLGIGSAKQSWGNVKHLSRHAKALTHLVIK
jgi:hypothetical protein